MASSRLTRFAHFVLALLLAVGPALVAEAEAAARPIASSPDEDADDSRDSELAASTLRRQAAQPKQAPERFTPLPRVPHTDRNSHNRLAPSLALTSLDPLGSRLRC